MSVLKYLSAGKSLIGLKPTAIRYQMGHPGALPRFGSARNPFRSKAQAAAATQKNSALPAPAPEIVTPSRTEVQPPVSEIESKAPVGKLAAEAAPVETPKTIVTLGMKSIQATRKVVSKLGDFAGQLYHGTKDIVLFRRKKAAPELPPRFVKTPIQGELSLDTVKVVRNDLTDADFEVVQKSRKRVAGGESKTLPTVSAPDTTALVREPKTSATIEAAPMVEMGREG